MACSGCGHRYNPSSPGPTVNRVSMRTGKVLGRYRIRKISQPSALPASAEPVVATPVKETK